MKTSLTIFPCVLGSTFLYIRVCPGLSFATKRIGPPCCTLFTFVTCCSLQIILSQNYLLPLISVLAENTLLETAYHFLLLLVGFDTLTYRKDYDRSPTLVGHQRVRNCYLLQSHVGIIIRIQAQPVRKADPNGGEGVYRNGCTAMDVTQNDGGIRPEVCKPIFVVTDPDLYIRRWAAEKLRDGNGITKYYMIKLHY